jgi:hypothetical protein
LIINRLHRAEQSCFDIDFRWSGFVNYIANPDDEVILVSSPTTLNQAVRVISFAKMIAPNINIKLVVHPLLRVQDDRIMLSSMKITEFFSTLGSSLEARLLLSTGLQWRSLESVIYSRDIHWCRLTASKFNFQNDNVSSERKPFFGKNEIGLLYKTIRSQKPLSSLQKGIAACIMPSCD